ncbi:MAG: patatin-like phospholipase family protein [Verrucomicrobia bacterium]|nr:patatin-like phospholipase family protein [Verrucomicrobiota bacterium]
MPISDESTHKVAQPQSAASPVTQTVSEDKNIEPGMALCLSGGGYRAMVFHLGTLKRLNETGLLRKLKRVSSVSGGSIAAGVLGLRWKQLSFDANDVASNFDNLVINPIRDLAGKTIDAEAIFGGIFSGDTINDKIIKAYERNLFGNATLQDLPSDNEGPRFVINATNIQTGALWRFSKPYMADYLVGKFINPDLRLSIAVAASSAFPPVLSPAVIDLSSFHLDPKNRGPLDFDPYTREAVLSDGGVYDNLGLETAWKRYKTILISDGGGKMKPEPEPKKDWARHSYRVLNVIDNQVRSLRVRQAIAAFENKDDEHDGAYWGIRTDIANYQVPDALSCPLDRTTELANIPTRLKRFEPACQERLINWGYAVCDAALRKHVNPALPKPAGFPFPGGV